MTTMEAEDYESTSEIEAVVEITNKGTSLMKRLSSKNVLKTMGSLRKMIGITSPDDDENKDDEGNNSEYDPLDEIPDIVLQEYRKVFDSVDSDMSGSISATELFVCFQTVGLVLTKFQIDYLVRRYIIRYHCTYSITCIRWKLQTKIIAAR